MNIVYARRFVAMALFSGTTATLACGTVDETFDADDGSEEVGTAHLALSLGSKLGAPIKLPAWTPTSTCGLNNGVTPSCATSSASDISFDWTAPSSGTFSFTTQGSNFDTVLVIAPYSNPGSPLACANAVSGTGGESVSLSLSSGQKLIVTVDGYASLCGTYKLNITKDCTGGCNSPPNCKSGPGTCSVSGTCVYDNAPAGTACDDGFSYTAYDVCDGNGSCAGTPVCSDGVTPCGVYGECPDGNDCW